MPWDDGGPRVPRSLGMRLPLVGEQTHTLTRVCTPTGRGRGPSGAAGCQDGTRANTEIQISHRHLQQAPAGPGTPLLSGAVEKAGSANKALYFANTARSCTTTPFHPPRSSPSSAFPGEASRPRALARSCCTEDSGGWAGRDPAQGHTSGKGVQPVDGGQAQSAQPRPVSLLESDLGLFLSFLSPRPYVFFCPCCSACFYFLPQSFLCLPPLLCLLLRPPPLSLALLCIPPAPTHIQSLGPPSAQAWLSPPAPAPGHRPSRGTQASQEAPLPCHRAHQAISAATKEPPPQMKEQAPDASLAGVGRT